LAIERLLQFSRPLLCSLYVTVLRRLVASGEQNDHDGALLDEVDAIARPIVNSQLGQIIADRPDITSVAEREATDSNVDAGFGDAVTQTGEPLRVLDGLADFDHCETVSHGIRTCQDGASARLSRRIAACAMASNAIALRLP
jgi:hypothetical protein